MQILDGGKPGAGASPQPLGRGAWVPGPRALCGLLIVILPFVVSCGRGGEAPARPSLIPTGGAVEETDVQSRTQRPSTARHPVLWLGLDGLDWELLDRLAGEGKMPNWKRLVSEGYSANLESFAPILSPLLWTTAATGMGPDVHRVLDFQEVDPKTGRKVPISGWSRSVPAVWNIASASGRTIGVVGWWATHPAEEVSGFFISDRASPILFSLLPLAGVAFPASLQSGVAQVVARDGNVSDVDLAPFVAIPTSEIAVARASGAGLENPVVALPRILSATRVSQRIARDLYDRYLPDMMLVYFEGTDEIGHVFAPYTPPKLACVSDRDAARYGKAVETYFTAVDRILGEWMRRAQEDNATLLVHSDHGFKWGKDRPCQFSSGNFATAAFWHRLNGVLAVWGARTRYSPERGRANLFDIAPTALALLDLAADRRMPGRVLTVPFTNLTPPARRDLPASNLIRRISAETVSAEQADEYAKKLLALGYLSPSEAKPLAPTGGDRPGMTEGAWNNLGVYFRDTRRNLPAAREAFEKSLQLRPDYYSPMYNLAILHRMKGETRVAEDWLFRSLAALDTDPGTAVVAWSHEYEKNGKTAAAKSLLERATHIYPANETVCRELAMLRYRSRDCPGAIATLSRFEAGSKEPKTLNALALFETCLAHREAVIRLLERSLALDPNQPEVARSLGVAKGVATER